MTQDGEPSAGNQVRCRSIRGAFGECFDLEQSHRRDTQERGHGLEAVGSCVLTSFEIAACFESFCGTSSTVQRRS